MLSIFIDNVLESFAYFIGFGIPCLIALNLMLLAWYVTDPGDD